MLIATRGEACAVLDAMDSATITIGVYANEQCRFFCTPIAYITAPVTPEEKNIISLLPGAGWEISSGFSAELAAAINASVTSLPDNLPE